MQAALDGVARWVRSLAPLPTAATAATAAIAAAAATATTRGAVLG
jgi:hypothetical protein